MGKNEDSGGQKNAEPASNDPRTSRSATDSPSAPTQPDEKSASKKSISLPNLAGPATKSQSSLPTPIPPSAARPPSSALTPAKKEPETNVFEKRLVSDIVSRFADRIKVVYVRALRIKIYADPADVIEVATFLRDEIGFDHAESAGGTDYPKDNQIEMIYHLSSYSRDDLVSQVLALATRTSRDDSRLPSLINLFKSVEYHERETFEMLGVYFEGHPRNERFLLPEDWADLPPLRKDFRIKGR